MLDTQVSCVQRLEQTLTANERKRAEQFRFSKDRMHFIADRGLLRAILSRYRDKDPRTLRFCYGRYGKPFLAWEFRSNGLFFNVSHLHGMALYAIECNREVGIDLEYIVADIACEQIAERFFSPYELSVLRIVSRQMQPEAFLLLDAKGGISEGEGNGPIAGSQPI